MCGSSTSPSLMMEAQNQVSKACRDVSDFLILLQASVGHKWLEFSTAAMYTCCFLSGRAPHSHQTTRCHCCYCFSKIKTICFNCLNYVFLLLLHPHKKFRGPRSPKRGPETQAHRRGTGCVRNEWNPEAETWFNLGKCTVLLILLMATCLLDTTLRLPGAQKYFSVDAKNPKMGLESLGLFLLGLHSNSGW